MSGLQDLGTLFRNMKPVLHDEIYVFSTLPDRDPPPGLNPIMRFEEREGTTLVLTEKDAVSFGLPHEFRSRMISLDVHSSLDAVGFLARIATALSAENMGVNPVAGFFHDHLFIPLGREHDAIRVLESLRDEAHR